MVAEIGCSSVSACALRSSAAILYQISPMFEPGHDLLKEPPVPGDRAYVEGRRQERVVERHAAEFPIDKQVSRLLYRETESADDCG